MLIKPYAPTNFVQKVKSVLNLPDEDRAPDTEQAAETVRLSSKEIFGDLFDQSLRVGQSDSSEPEDAAPHETVTAEDHSPSPAQEPVQKRRRSAADDVDRMLADTLAGVRLPSPKKKRKDTAAEDLDKMLENTLSGLETSRTREPKPAEDTPAKRDAAKGPEQDAVGGRFNHEPSAISSGPAVPPKPPDQSVSGDVEEDPFPEMADVSAEPEPDEAPFEGVGERAGEQPVSGTTLMGGEEPPHRVQSSSETGLTEDSGHFGQYVLLEKIATGGMAEVWKARMRGLEGFEKIVAIKKILPHLSDNDEFIDMFVDEAKLAAQLSHNNIIHIYDLGKIDGSWFIAMEYNDGYDLKSLMAQGREAERPLPIPLSLFIASKVASAHDYAHRKKGFDEQELGVVHRDVSPQNVLISREGDIKICDFGIAKAATKASHTQAGSLKGKLQYMSPEQAWGRHVDHRSDIFATAAVLFEMLAGRKLFSGDSELSVLDQVREARVPLPSTYNPQVSAEIDEVVLKGLEKDPAERFRTAGEMARAIDAILSNYKPAPSSLDLASYIEAIEEPENHPMPPVAAEQPSARIAPPVEPEEESAVKAEPVKIPLPVPAPVPAAATEPFTVTVEPSGRKSVAAALGPETDEKGPEPTAPVFGATVGSEKPAKKSRAVPIAIALIVVLATVAGGAVVMMRQEAETGGPQSDVSAALGANPPAGAADARAVEPPLVETPAEDVVSPEALEEEMLATAASGELGQEDLALIEQAVRDRIAAERRRLEAQRQEESQPPPPRTQPERETADTPPPVSRSPQATPPPAAPRSKPAEPSAPAAEPPPAAATPAVAQPAEPAPPEPAKPAVRRGDLVEPGTPGLTEPQILELEKVSYPLLARRQKVEGLVIVRALISEDGKVLEVELLRGVSQNVGLNEAAIEMVRGGKYQAGRMGNVQIRTWKTIPIPFRIQ
ncbi:MAG: TonB family protein, partial [Acidobacteria bacterium]|nr:TonB family protein [Acidobacteriota bacterium]